LVSRHTKTRGESWRARAAEPKGSVQARTVGITAPGVDRVVADKAQTHCPHSERLAPWFLRNRSCLDTYELLNSFILYPFAFILCIRWAFFNSLLLAILCLLGINTFAAANPFDDASAAYERGDYVQAMKLFRQLAENGHQWAQRRVGSMYAEGKGVPQDYQEAVKWYRLAAAQGYAPAEYSLGVAYEKGQGVPQDYREAVKWYRLAAAQGNELARVNLGLMYTDGRGVRQDFVRAHMWFNLAAAASTGNSRDAATENRDRIASRMTAEQIGTAQEMARRCQESKLKNCD
jgi:Sel1 repeat